MEKKKIINIAYWIMIAVVIATCIVVIFYLTGNAKQCIADPLKYYEGKVGAMCYCMNENAFKLP